MPRNESLDKTLARRGALPAQDALKIVLQAAVQVSAMHLQAGRIHGAITPRNVVFDEGEQVRLVEPETTVLLGDGNSVRELCPPELQGQTLVSLPASIPAAQARLRELGLTMDPSRVDVYQLGVLLCRLVTGQSVQSYLLSPQTSGRVPALLRPLVERALGYEECGRFAGVKSFIQAAQELLVPEADLPFTALGHFRIVARLGHGGMGDVYKGYEPALDRPVAIKVLPPELARLDDFVRRFRAEATAVARLTHPNVIQIHFIGEDQGHHFFAMQYVEGESLAEFLARRGCLPPDETLPIVEQTLAGLGAAHKQGIVHRDIKPANLLLDRENHRVVVADFGLVKSAVAGTRMTATGVVLGTVDYISPEQGRGQAVDARSDLYSIGVLLYHMLSGNLPFEADSPTAMVFQHVYEQPKPLHDLAPQVPESLCTVVHKLLAKSPADRQQTAEEVLADLRTFRADRSLSPGGGSPAPAPAARPKRVIVDAPAFEELLLQPLAPGHEPLVSWPPQRRGRLRERLGRVRRWLFGLAQDRTPAFVQRLQTTQQQVDGAVAEYERRQNRFQQLVTEAEGVLDELKRQAASHRRAAVAARHRADSAEGDGEARQAIEESIACQQAGDQLTEQAAEQERQLERMQLRLAQMNATLHKVRSQRDVLNARLNAARAKLQLADGAPQRSPDTVSAVVRMALLLAAVGLLVGGVMFFWGSGPELAVPEVGRPTDAASPAAGPREIGPFPANPFEPPRQADDQVVAGPREVNSRPASPPTDRRAPPLAETAHGGAEQVVRKFTDLGWNVTSLAFSPDGRYLAVGKLDAAVLLFEIESGRRLATQTELRELGQVTALSFAPDGRRLFLGGYSGAIQVWHLGSDGVMESAGLSDALNAHQKAVRCIALDPDGRFVVSGGDDKRLLWQQPGPTTQSRTLATLEGAVQAVRLTSGGTTVMASDGEELVWVDVRTLEVTRRLPLGQSRAQAVSISPDGAHVARSSGYVIETWEADGERTQVIHSAGSEIQWSVSFTPDGRSLLSGGRGNLYVWDVATGTRSASFSLGGVLYVQTMAISPDGTLVAAVPSAAGQTLYVFRLAR